MPISEGSCHFCLKSTNPPEIDRQCVPTFPEKKLSKKGLINPYFLVVNDSKQDNYLCFQSIFANRALKLVSGSCHHCSLTCARLKLYQIWPRAINIFCISRCSGQKLRGNMSSSAVFLPSITAITTSPSRGCSVTSH